MTTDPTIGVRIYETIERFERVKASEHILDDRQKVFIYDMLEKLEKYRQRTYVSAKQLNYLSSIEEEIDRRTYLLD